MTVKEKEIITGICLLAIGAIIHIFGFYKGLEWISGFGQGLIFGVGFLGFQDLWTGRKIQEEGHK